MNPRLRLKLGRPASARRAASQRFRPGLDGLEERLVLSTAAGHVPFIEAAASTHALVHTGAHHTAVHPHVQPNAHAHLHHPITRAVPHHPAHFGRAGHRFAATHGQARTTTSVTATATAPTPTTNTAPPPATTTTTNTNTTTSTSTSTTPTTGTTTGSTSTSTSSTTPQALVTLDLKPLDVNLLGLELKTSEITVTVSAQPGSGALLGNLLTDVSGLLNLQGVNNALNNVLGSVVTLANSASLSVNGVTTNGSLGSSQTATTTPVLTLHVAPVNLNLLGAIVQTSPIDVSLTAHTGQGLVLGNVVNDLAHLLDQAPNNGKLTVDYLNQQLQGLIGQLNSQLPNVNASPSSSSSTSTAPTTGATSGTTQVLSLTVPPIDLNLLGLVLQTDQIQVNANAQSGGGELLGNLLTDILNTAGATPQNLSTLNSEINTVLGKVVGVLNASTLTLPTGAVGALSQALQTLSLPNLVNASGNASTPVLNLDIAALSGDSQPPVDVNLLGLVVTTNNVHAQLTAQTGDGQILGNLVYNASHLLDPGGSLNLLGILGQLGI